MSKKDFELIARTLSVLKPETANIDGYEQWRDTVEAFAEALSKTNARFARERFVAACEK